MVRIEVGQEGSMRKAWLFVFARRGVSGTVNDTLVVLVLDVVCTALCLPTCAKEGAPSRTQILRKSSHSCMALQHTPVMVSSLIYDYSRGDRQILGRRGRQERP